MFKWNSPMSLYFKSKAIKDPVQKGSEVEGWDRLKARASYSKTVSQVANAKGKFLKEIKGAIPVNTQMASRTALLLIREFWGFWIDQSSYNISLSQSLTQSKALTLFSSMEAERGEEAGKKILKPAEGGLLTYDRSLLHNSEAQGKAIRADVEATASYPEDPAQIINEGGCIKLGDSQSRWNNLLSEEDAI